MLVRQERRHLVVRQDGRQKFARYAGVQQPVAVLREDRWHPHGIVDAEPDEPAEQQIVLHLLHQLPLGVDREQDLDQRRVDDLAGLAQRMPRRDAIFEIHI